MERMSLDDAIDALRTGYAPDSAALVVALALLAQYRLDIRSLGREGFCEGEWYRDMNELLDRHRNGE